MKRAKFEPIFDQKSDFCEKSVEKPVETFVPGQAIDLATLIKRFENGQRLNVHANFEPMDNMTRGSMYVEDFEDAPPDDIHDIVDVENAIREHEVAKREHKKKVSEKGKEAPPKEATAPEPPTPSQE